MLLETFYRRRGAITIMLAFLLVTVLSLSSTLMEVARYRSLERLYKEMEENAAFSMLSEYDRDLFKKYGLLAMKQTIGEEELLEYLRSNMNIGLADYNGIDSMLSIAEEGIEIEKLYNLAQHDVFKTQISEFCAYRAPINIANEALNIEDTIKDLVEKLEESLPILNMFLKLVDVASNMTDALEKEYKFVKACVDLKDDVNTYKDKVSKYNDAVSERNAWEAMDEEEIKNTPNYYERLEELRQNVKASAGNLQSAIGSLKEALGTQKEAYESYMSSYEKLLGSGIDAVLAEAKVDADAIKDEKTKANAKKMIEDMEKGYKDTNEYSTLIQEEYRKYMNSDIEKTQEELSAQSGVLEGDGASLNSVTEVYVVSHSYLTILVDMFLSTIAQIEKIVQQYSDALKQIWNCIEAFKYVQSLGIVDPMLNQNIQDDIFYNLPGKTGGRECLAEVTNPYEELDELKKNIQIAETEEVAAAIDFDTSVLNTNDVEAKINGLVSAMNNTLSKWDVLADRITSFKTSINIVKTIIDIGKIAIALGDFLLSLINVAYTFLEIAKNVTLEVFLYSRLYPAIYAKEMFSNRCTETSDKKMNGESYTIVSVENGELFEKANVEYVVCGTSNEIKNQTQTFLLLLLLRVICNIPAIVSDTTLMGIVEELCATIVGIIVAVILVMVVFFLEAYLDMVFLLYDKDGIDFIKLKGYLKFDASGLDNLKVKVKSLIEQAKKQSKDKIKNAIIGESNAGNKEDKDGKAKKNVKNLLNSGWTYKDHLLVLLVLFVDSDRMYARCADLIEMDLKYSKKMAGKIEEFKLSEMATYIRVESEAQYTPLLPIPSFPGLNTKKIPIKNIHYSGY